MKTVKLLSALVASAMTVSAQPVITNQPANQTVIVGSNVTFSVMVTGIGPFTYQWRLNGTNLPNNIITTVAGNGIATNTGDGGAAISASLYFPEGVGFDAIGNLYIADHWNNKIRRVDTNGIITTVAGNGIKSYSGDGGLATNASLNFPSSVAFDGSGNLFIADQSNSRIRMVNTNGVITTVVGKSSSGFSGDGGAATNASLYAACGVAFDASGNLFISDTYNYRIRKVNTNGIINTVSGQG